VDELGAAASEFRAFLGGLGVSAAAAGSVEERVRQLLAERSAREAALLREKGAELNELSDKLQDAEKGQALLLCGAASAKVSGGAAAAAACGRAAVPQASPALLQLARSPLPVPAAQIMWGAIVVLVITCIVLGVIRPW
jgi:hypothetical protein